MYDLYKSAEANPDDLQAVGFKPSIEGAHSEMYPEL